jgi:hypothetical protein
MLHIISYESRCLAHHLVFGRRLATALGKIFVTNLEECIRIRTRERGEQGI